jgi:hypothetical protein
MFSGEREPRGEPALADPAGTALFITRLEALSYDLHPPRYPGDPFPSKRDYL